MNIVVVGTGYVGLVSGACFSEFGFAVTCVDKDSDKITSLEQGEIPIYEPGLDDFVKRNSAAGRLRFTTELGSAVSAADAVFIAVGTPQGDDGSAELRYVHAVADQIGESLSFEEPGAQADGYKVILTKSTVPIGTSDEVARRVGLRAKHPFVVCSNPEFERIFYLISSHFSKTRP